MPEQTIHTNSYSEEVNEIITAVPSWILRTGTTIIFLTIFALLAAAAFIHYPDIIKTSLKINSLNAPKPVYTRTSGKLVKLLVSEKSKVSAGESLAFLESTASHSDVLNLSEKLNTLRESLIKMKKLNPILLSPNSNLGELQIAYQNFDQEYTQFLATQQGGYYQKQRLYLEKDLESIKKLRSQIMSQQKIQQLEYENTEQQYKAYQKLIAKNVISKSEFKDQENKYLSGKYPLQQTETSLLTNTGDYSGKQKEILVLENTIAEKRSMFLQSLNGIISETDKWINQYIVRSPVAGTVTYAGIVQQNENVTMNQELFIINPGNTDFFGEIQIPQDNMGKMRTGERALVKMHSYPYEQFGMIRGKISYISEVAFKDSVFIAKVNFTKFENKDSQHKIILKNGMVADVDIITEESSLLQRFYRNIVKEFMK